MSNKTRHEHEHEHHHAHGCGCSCSCHDDDCCAGGAGDVVQTAAGMAILTALILTV